MIYPILAIAGGILAVIFLYYLQLYFVQCYRLRKFRGPFPLPIIGNISGEALFLLRYLAKLRKKYGRMFTFFAFTKPYLVICEPVAVRRILSDTTTFFKGKDYTELFSLGFGEGLVTSNGEKHKHDRGIFGKYFIRSYIAKFVGNVNDITVDAIDTILAPELKHSPGQNIEEFFALLALRVFYAFAMSHKATVEQERRLAKIVSKGSFEMGRIVGLGLPPYDFVPSVRYVKENRALIWQDFKKIVNARRDLMARGEASDIDDCLTAMLTNNLNEKELTDHFVTLVCAGHDTTAFFSSYMSYLLATHPEAQDRLRQEIIDVVGPTGYLSADHISEMKYLQKVMQETLRLYSIIPALTRESAEEVHIKEANLTIPKGQTIMIPMFLMNRDPELWDNPSAFDPDRFEGKGDFTSAKNGFFPFGYGSRTCIGNTLAQFESAVFLCHLLRRYRFKAKPGYKPAIMSGISLTTSNGIEIVVESL